MDLSLELSNAFQAYRDKFNEGLAIFGLPITDKKLLELITISLERGSPLTDKELADGAGVEEAPPDAIL